jgi:hypothetical protein
VGKPQEVPDEDHEVVYERVAAVDVAKASGVVCLRVLTRPGRAGSPCAWPLDCVWWGGWEDGGH